MRKSLTINRETMTKEDRDVLTQYAKAINKGSEEGSEESDRCFGGVSSVLTKVTGGTDWRYQEPEYLIAKIMGWKFSWGHDFDFHHKPFRKEVPV